ncbi:MAG: DUF4136 domain-containing protein [Sphingomonadaceae bacterium]|nr:DUF4136 domain-containing protein [Sphingomonadaceae bacterium]
MKSIAPLAALASLALVSACASGPATRDMEVTRSHLGQPIPARPFATEPADHTQHGLEWESYANIVAEELTRLGFSRTTLEESEMVAVVEVQRGARAALRRSTVSIGIGGGRFGGDVGVGVGGGVTVPVGGGAGEVAVTQLEVALKRRSEGTLVWYGRAIREDRLEDADPSVTVRRLATALFQGFPGESGRTIEVE